MNNGESYQEQSKNDALQCLALYVRQNKWKNDKVTVLDIGCGDGSVTMNILKAFIPSDLVRLVGCDISENMIQCANEKYANDHTSFVVQDIEDDLPNELRGAFDHVFSFNTLHCIQNQELAFTNIYNLLSEGGKCFLVFLGQSPFFDVYHTLSRSTKWETWCKDAERYISPYHDCQDPEKKVKDMMTSIGFTSVEVYCLKRPFVYPNLVDKESSINPFKIPKDLEEKFLRDYFNILRNMHNKNQPTGNIGLVKEIFNYSLIVAQGEKIIDA